MMELIVIACLLASPDTCKEHRLRLTEQGMDASQCMYASIPLVSRWQTLHRKWRIKAWKCTVLSEDENA